MINNNSGSSYNILIDRLEAFANGHKMINQFSHGSISLIDIPKENRYPVMHVAPGSITPMPGMMEYSFDVLFFDCPRAKEEKADYQREVISDMTRLALDLIAEVMNGNVLFNRDVELSGTSTIDPFVEDYSQVVTGVTLSLVLQVAYDWSACDIPADYAVGGNNTGGNGSQVGLILKTNGTLNAVQTLLDLVEGTNINIEDLGDGRVRISAIGGGGGGADWGSIGGNIEDQEDLIDLLATYATQTELTDSVDTLQTNINAVADDLNNHVGDTDNPHATTKDQVGLGNADNTSDANKPISTATQTALDSITDVNWTGDYNNGVTYNVGDGVMFNGASFRMINFIGAAGYPPPSYPGSWLQVTDYVSANDIGLGNVDNTSDANKPISSATQNALNAKEPTITAGTTSQYYRGDKTFQTLDNAAVGLGNVDNTSDEDKPVSLAQANAIGAKQDTLVSGTNIKTINGISILGSGNIPISSAVNQAFRTYGTGFTLAASSGDRWYVIQSGTNSGTESNVQVSAEFAMTFTDIRVRTTGTQSATGSLVFTLRKNGVDQFALTIAAGAAAGVYTATGSFSVVAGDLINWKIRNNATATSANIAQLSAIYQ